MSASAPSTPIGLTAALSYAARGWHVFPVYEPPRPGQCSCSNPKCDRQAKHPRTEHGLKDATIDEAQIRAWWAKWPLANIGIATGAISGIFILDPDGEAGALALRALEARHGALPTTLTARTGREAGGRHLYFQHPGKPVVNKAEIGPGLDVRGDGGYVVAPPSIHVTGTAYLWVQADVQVPPDWLVKLVTKKAPAAAPVPPPRQYSRAENEHIINRATAYAQAAAHDPAEDGKGGSTATIKLCAALTRGFCLDEATVYDIVARHYNPWCKPPWDEAGLRRKVSESLKMDDFTWGYLRDAPNPNERPPTPREVYGPGADDGDEESESDSSGLVMLEDALRRLAAEPPLVPIPTGIQQLDALLDGGIRPKRLTVLCGPPGAGKTALIGEIARRVAKAASDIAPVLICSTEIEEDEQAARIAAPMMQVSADSMLRHEVDANAAAELVRGWPIALLNLDLDPEVPVDPLAVIAAHMQALEQRTGRKPVVVLDYMQDVVTLDPDKRRLGVSAIARRLRRFAQEHECVMFACSSVSRAHYGNKAKVDSEDAEDPRSWLAAAKESGDVEFAAAVLLYLDTSHDVDEAGLSSARIIVAKARMGRTGFVGLRFNGSKGTFAEDAGALASMGKAATDAKDATQLLAVIRSTRQKPQPWRDLRAKTGLGARRADTALARLESEGRITYRLVKDSTNSRARAQRWLVDPSWLSDPLPIGFIDAGVSGVSEGQKHP